MSDSRYNNAIGSTITLDEIGERTASDLLHEVARAHEPLRVVLESGEIVTLDSPAPLSHNGEKIPELKPLPQYDIVIPEDWKDAVYGPGGSGRP